MITALVRTSGSLMLIVGSAGQASAVEPKVTDALQSVRLKQSELSGEIGRRINDLIYKNYMALDLDKDFLNAFRTRPYDGTKGWAYIGVGKVVDAGSMFAAYTGDSKVAQRTKQTIDELIKTRDPDGYLGFMKREPDGKHNYRNWTLHEHEYLILGLTDHYRYCGDKTSLEHARKLADYVLETFPKNPRPEGVCTAGLPESMLKLYHCTGDIRYLRFAAETRHGDPGGEVACAALRDWEQDYSQRNTSHIYVNLARCYTQTMLYRLEPNERLLKMSRRMLDEFLSTEEDKDELLIIGSGSRDERFGRRQDGSGSVCESCVTASREDLWRRRGFVLLLFTLWLETSQSSQAAFPSPDETGEAARWAAAIFGGVAEIPPESPPGLVVLANNDPVQRNARAGRPMRIVNAEFTHGLYCHAFSKIIARLPGPGDVFTAVAGVDSNEQTGGGRGSVRFAVLVDETESFKSGVMREGMAAVPVNIKLDGAREFVLQVDDAGDGISCDQADWADAKVTLRDGRVLWLADLPLREGTVRPPFTNEPPFSFQYDGQALAELAWKPARSTGKLDARRTEHALRYADEPTGLEVRCVAVEYHDFPVVEWTVYFKNTGTGDTRILSDILALDARFHRTGGGEFVLHHNVGSLCTPNDFQPLETALQPGNSKRITAAGGRPSNGDWPYFNVAWPGAGLIVAVGWPGQWAAEFTADAANGLQICAGQERTHFKLHPGEEVRTPLMVIQFWEGDWIAAQNVWRRWMLAHNLPRPGGQLPPVQMAACSSHQFGEMIHADSASQKLFVDRYLEEKLPLDYWWMDAGWYWCDGQWPKTGTWEVDTKRFPGGLRPISDHARAKGVKTIVWFEPERVHSGTWLTENHPQWILGGKNGGLLNLGNPRVRQWLTEHVDKLLTEQGIDLYRQDFNIYPLSFWQKNDAEDRQGMTENHHVTGYLAYWDELRRRHPNMLIDSCASGGRRNDLETMRRAVPLLRSDYIMEPVGNQGHTYGLSFWLPFQGTGTGSRDISPYLLRSTLVTHFTACFDVRRKDLDYDLIRRVLGQWKQYAPYYFGDYYPLTPYSLDQTAWIGWQFDVPEKGEGVVQAFRRAESVYEVARFKLRGLDPGAGYVFTNLDSGQSQTLSGRELLDQGLAVPLTDQPGSAVITYKKR